MAVLLGGSTAASLTVAVLLSGSTDASLIVAVLLSGSTEASLTVTILICWRGSTETNHTWYRYNLTHHWMLPSIKTVSVDTVFRFVCYCVMVRIGLGLHSR